MNKESGDICEPTIEEVAEFRRTDPQSMFMNDASIVKHLKKLRAPAPPLPPKPEVADWPFGFVLPTRSKRGPLWTKSADNPAKTETPNPDYLLPEVELTPPDKAVEMLAKMFPGLNAGNASDIDRALKLGVSPAVKACEALRIDPARLVVFPWIKRSVLKRIGQLETEHHGALIEQVVFPRLEQVYKERVLAFKNYRVGKMATDNYLMMQDEVAEWLKAREDETTTDICFSAALIDAFHGFSVDATRYEAKKENRLINGTCYLVQQMLLTQPQLLSANNHQGWDMPGDKHDYNGQSRFPSALCSAVVGGGFRFSSANSVPAYSRYGSVVFLAESLSD